MVVSMSPKFNLKPKTLFLIGAVAGLLLGGRCVWLWQPERQVSLHQRHFLEAVADRKWKKIAAALADDFRDSAGHDKAWALKESREVLRQFFVLSVREREAGTAFATPERREATVTTRFRLEGNGTPVAEYAMEVVNGSGAPFVFVWKRQGWKPWDWQITAIRHPLVQRAAWEE